MKKIIKKNSTSIYVIFFALTFVILLNSGTQNSIGYVEHKEDFDTTTYMDSDATDAWGWGAGRIESPRLEMEVIANLPLTHKAQDIELYGDYAFIADTLGGLKIVDISDPTNPTLSVSQTIGGGVSAHSVQVTFHKGEYYVFVATENGHAMYNISDPTAPIPYSFLPDHDGYYPQIIPMPMSDFQYAEGIYLAAVNTAPELNYLLALPFWFGAPYQSVQLEGQTHKLAYNEITPRNNIFNMYVATDYGVYEFEKNILVSDLINVNYIARTETPGKAIDLQIDPINPDILYVADGPGGLCCISTKETNREDNGRGVLWSLGVLDSALGIYVEGNHAYIADGYAGLTVIDISDISHPVRKGNCDTDGQARDVVVRDSYAYIADGTKGLTIIKVKEKIPPILKGVYRGSYPYENIEFRPKCASNDIVFSGGGEGVDYLQFIDVEDPENPIFHDIILSIHTVMDACVFGKYVVVAMGDDGAAVIDAYDTSQPTAYYRGIIPEVYEIWAAEKYGDYAFMSNVQLTLFEESTRLIIDRGGCHLGLCNQTLLFDEEVISDFQFDLTKLCTISILGNLTIWETEDTTDIKQLGKLDILEETGISGLYYDIVVKRDFAIVGVSDFGSPTGGAFHIIDISDPNNPSLILTHHVGAGCSISDIEVLENYCYIAEYDGLTIYDIEDLSMPEYLGTIHLDARETDLDVRNLVLASNYLYLGAGDNTEGPGLYIYEIIRERCELYKPIGYAQSISYSDEFPDNIEKVDFFIDIHYLDYPDSMVEFQARVKGGGTWKNLPSHACTVTFDEEEQGSDLMWRATLYSTNENISCPAIQYIIMKGEFKIPEYKSIPVILLLTTVLLIPFAFFLKKKIIVQ